MNGNYITISQGNEAKKTIELPDYGEVKIVCHNGKITFVETTVKDKVE